MKRTREDMMRLGIALVIAGAGMLAAAPALADTWSGAYGGTIVSTYTDGRVVDVYVNADHSYSIAKTDGSTILKGTWADTDAGSCFTQTDPAPDAGAKPLCFPIKNYQVGDSFQGADPSGAFTGVIKAGR